MEQRPYIKIKCIDPIMPSDIILHYAFTASHMSPVEQPVVVCDSLLDFLKMHILTGMCYIMDIFFNMNFSNLLRPIN